MLNDAALFNYAETCRVLAQTMTNGAVLVFDRELRYVMAEGTALPFPNYTPSAFQGKTFYEVSDPEAQVFLGPKYLDALAGHSSQFEIEQSGHSYEVLIRPIADRQGIVFAGILISTDTTERKRLSNQLSAKEELLRQAQHMMIVGQQARSVIHDFNNILTAIMGYTELSLLSLEEENPISSDLLEIKMAAERATSLIVRFMESTRAVSN